MGGFNPGAVDTAFFPDGRIKTFLLCNLGYGDDDLLNPRAFRFDFDEVCTLL
ncbi:MAG: nitroreductase family protein, partial [Rhodospirillaceae bacterium]|nr:nitroreductase family protein [Rhodospirillaceae bacterium]